METVVYTKRYADRTRVDVQADAEEAIQEAFAKAEKMIDEKGGDITISFKDDEANSTLTVHITGPRSIVNAFTRIFKEWKQVKHVRIANTISQRRYNTTRGMMAANSNMGIPHSSRVNRKSNTIPKRIGTITTNAAYVGRPIANLARVRGTRKAVTKNVLRGLPYNAPAAAAFATFQAVVHKGGPSAIAEFARTNPQPSEYYQRLVELYAADEIRNALIENPRITPDELLTVGLEAFMFVAEPIFGSDNKRLELLSRAAMRTVPMLIQRYRGLRAR